MIRLDDLDRIKKLDSGKVAESIAVLPLQIRQVIADAGSIKVPNSYNQVTEVVINGMGGSNIGVGILKSVFGDQLKVPVIITPGYEVPAYVGPDTLYIISSYSGTTEEPLSVYAEVKKRGAKIMAIAESGKGKLQDLIIKDKLPAYVFKPAHNPSGQPRYGLGYSVFGMMMLLAKAGLININEKEIEDLIEQLEYRNDGLKPQAEEKNNLAKKIASQLFSRQPILVSAEFLIGNMRAMRNQFCESSKNFASYLVLPDLNHFAMEGLVNPASNKQNLIFLFFDSSLYHPRVQKRAELTREVIKKNGIGAIDYKLTGATKLEQAFELLQLGSWISFYLGMLNQVNPVEIPWVDWFKKRLD
jgi:glucose/mannose-6-phosphate isomerase